MKIDYIKGLIDQAIFQPSPNFDERPSDQQINLLVIHNISLPPGQFEGNYVSAFFCNQLDNSHAYFKEINHLKVSSHLFIRRCGELWQFVPFTKRAWHAGESMFQGRSNCNDFSIGVELEGTDTLPYTIKQYEQLAIITRQLIEHYPITIENIVGHADIAPQRKTDPGSAFDWVYFKNLVRYQMGA